MFRADVYLLEISSNIILPQEKTMLTIRVNPRKQLGHFNKSVYVNSDAENPVIILRIKGEII